MLVYDFEVFKYDWVVVIFDIKSKQYTKIINDSDRLSEFVANHNKSIWIGYNNRQYDQYIMKSILCGLNPYECSKWIVQDKKQGFEFSRLFNNVKLIQYDVMYKRSLGSLKKLEGFLGHNIKETDVPFDIDRKLTKQEIQDTLKYCTYDVDETTHIFFETISEFKAQLGIINTFGLPLSDISKTQAKLAAKLLGAKSTEYKDDWDIRLPNDLKLGKYQFVGDWFLNKENHYEDASLKLDVIGVPHVVAWGGLHGALKKCVIEPSEDELLVDIDVGQMYPTIMAKHNLISRSATKPELLLDTLETSLKLKAEGKKAEREPYKRINNIIYGAMGDEFNNLYDPLHRKLVCVFGQVFILDLLDKLDGYITLIQLRVWLN